MRKRAILALMLIVTLAVTAGCSLIVKDAEVDKQTVIVDVAGKQITKGEVAQAVQNTLEYQAYMYSMYGMSFDPTDKDVISSAQDSVINTLIQNAVLEKKQADLGMNAFTDEELAAMQTEAETSYQQYFDAVKSGEFADTQLTGDELNAAVEAKMTEYGYPTQETLLNSAKTTAATDKLKADVVKDVAVTDEEIQAEYDTRVESAKTTYADTPAAYGTAVQNGSATYYTPAGYRYVKHILRKFLAEDQTKIDDLNSQISAKNTQLTNVNGSLADLGEDTGADDEAAAANRKELNDTLTTLNAEIADLQTQLDAAKEAGYAALQPTVDEINGKLAQGQDFDALMTEYGEDSGMQSEPAKTTGYLVCAASTNWLAEFRDAAMALAQVGDVSQPVRSAYGIHILKYVGDAAEGPAALDSVKSVISDELLTARQDEKYNATVEEWVQEAAAKIYKDRLAD